jgi:L-ascorbate metabolism protein UlaG (beta-lactamase superfamily)
MVIFLILGLSGIYIDLSCASAKYSKGDKQMSKIESSSQYNDGKFINTIPGKEPSFTQWPSIMMDLLFKRDQRKPVRRVDLTHFNCEENNQLNVTWLGHSSLLINLDGYKIIADPVFAKNLILLGPSRYNGNIPLNVEDLPEIDMVIISHNHYDHLNKQSIQELDDKTKKFFVPLAVGAELEGWGISRDKIIELDWWDEHQVDDDLFIAAAPAQHFSGRSLSDRNKTLWGSWVIIGPNHKIYFGGDSGYFEGFKQIGQKYGPFDITFVETGAYNKMWHHIHMFPEETVQAHIDLSGKVLHPIHWATFDLSLHSWFDPMKRLTIAADSLNVNTALPIVGETTIYESYIPNQRWWEEVLVEAK